MPEPVVVAEMKVHLFQQGPRLKKVGNADGGQGILLHFFLHSLNEMLLSGTVQKKNLGLMGFNQPIRDPGKTGRRPDFVRLPGSW